MQIKAFLRSIKGLAPNTVKAYEQTLWQIHQVSKSNEPTDDEIKAFLSRYKASSLHRHKAAIKDYLMFRKRPWPFTAREFRSPRRHVPRYAKPEDVWLIINGTSNKDDRMYVLTLFILGCRISELMGISEQDITDAGVLVTTKGGHQRLKRVTKDFLKQLQKYASGKNGSIFPEKYSYYYAKLKELAKITGVGHVSPHMLRHARAVDLLNKGMKLPFVQQFLGHSSIATTSIYLEITGGELSGELERVENGERD